MEAVGAVRLNGQKSVKFFLTALSAFADIGAPMKKKASFIQTGLSQTIASIDQRESRNGPPRRRMSKLRLMCTSAIVIVTWSGFSALGTVYNSDGTATSVQYLHDNFAQAGDSITLPAGTFTWSTPVTISKAITLQGSGSGRIIGDTKSSVQVGTGPKTFITTGRDGDQLFWHDSRNEHHEYGGIGYVDVLVDRDASDHYDSGRLPRKRKQR